MISIKNKKLALAAICFLGFALQGSAQTLIGKTIKVNLFSSTPVEDIKASSNMGTAVLVTQTQELAVQVSIKSLVFDKKLMQEHFNENYMESDKYPLAKFKGTIEPKIDWTKDGEYAVSAKGVLSVHGVDQPRNINGKISIKNGIVNLDSSFEVTCVAHQIKIPRLVFAKIAEVIQLKVSGTLTPLK
ncbi:YceI family protein [Pedobacter sp. Hv1]|uniref:YceI family protein n=1 Tax=Pedobacter sp. Hv1 TaxID=1740090 RepID=UPI0009E88DA4|nr:YceI family protein [Pedobacter sp. Hv1]